MCLQMPGGRLRQHQPWYNMGVANKELPEIISSTLNIVKIVPVAKPEATRSGMASTPARMPPIIYINKTTSKLMGSFNFNIYFPQQEAPLRLHDELECSRRIAEPVALLEHGPVHTRRQARCGFARPALLQAAQAQQVEPCRSVHPLED